ncbi:D-arabinono-1,4-lactone oxidase [Microbacterium sp. ZXX196]|uniref:D-arabinono-1,4-lactone oxidase n=1 Tax=Microbacterium sp. ZXX196 TaxID=2609291 RepID=UPI0027B95BDF|nr:D-arabinono-1,4-lactone oxidase [Microbacterium sp. ZXX196]
MATMPDTSERNWAGNVAYRAERILEPTSIAELRGAVSAGGRVRALGSRHSFTDIADTDGALISLARMPREIEILPGAVRVAGGLRYGDIVGELDAAGRALANLASLPHISVAGAVQTGTHGSGDRVPSLAAAVRAVTLVGPDGELRTVRRGDAEFGGSVVSLGSLGIVTSLELDTEPAYEVAQTVFDGPLWDRILERFDEVSALGHSVSIFTTWAPGDRAQAVWVKRRALAAGPGDAAVADLLGAVRADGPRHPIAGAVAEACSPQLGEPGPWFARLPHFRLDFTPSVGDEVQSEYLVPRQHAAAAIAAVRARGEAISSILHVCEIRTIAADDQWLSPSSGRDSVGLHFTWHRDEQAVRRVLPVLEGALEPFDARPHWGKVFDMGAERLRPLYPRFADFRALRARVDPSGVFGNAFLDRVGLGA